MVALKQRIEEIETTSPGPILKWAGGKTQLLPVIKKNYPKQLVQNEIETYIEPFVGGAAVYFDIYNHYTVKNAYLIDSNEELVNLYRTLKQDVDGVISELTVLEKEYLGKNLQSAREEVFYSVREEYNQNKADVDGGVNTRRAALTVFLNRTCFNGLYRVNSKGGFNVPHGKYKNPRILFDDKLRSVASALRDAEILLGDFADCADYVSRETFIYYDPPYRPISKTSSFNSYSKGAFDDDEQRRLAELFKKLDAQGVYQLLSNSDPSNYIEDPFFDDLYEGFDIQRVAAKRSINADAAKRGQLSELLIRNYE